MIHSQYKLIKQGDSIQPWHTPFPILRQSIFLCLEQCNYCNCCFLPCIQVSLEAGKVIWYSHLFQNFPQFIVIHAVKGFDIVNEADVFLGFSWFFCDPAVVGNLISGFSAFSKSSLYLWKFSVHIQLKPSLKDFEHYLQFKSFVCSLSYKLCPSLCNPMDYSPPDSPVHGIFQAKILESVTIFFSRGSSRPRDQTCISCISRWILYHTTSHFLIMLFVFFVVKLQQICFVLSLILSGILTPC